MANIGTLSHAIEAAAIMQTVYDEMQAFPDNDTEFNDVDTEHADWRFVGAGAGRVTFLHVPSMVAYKVPKHNYASQSNQQEPSVFSQWQDRVNRYDDPTAVCIPVAQAFRVEDIPQEYGGADSGYILAVTYLERDGERQDDRLGQLCHNVCSAPVLPNPRDMIPNERFSMGAVRMVEIPAKRRAEMMAEILLNFAAAYGEWEDVDASIPRGVRAYQYLDDQYGIPDNHHGNVYLTSDGRLALVDLA